MRQVNELMVSGLAVIDRAFKHSTRMVPLFSGGHDSLSACFVASHHPRFTGEVYQINTTIGSKASRQFSESVCLELGWRLHIFTSNFSYEKFVRRLGFPGPGAHQWVYNKLKDRCISSLAKGYKTALITGCRSAESVRRMGHVAAIQVGETSRKTGVTRRTNRVWTAPCHDWTSEEQVAFMDAFALPRNPVKMTPLAMSGECFCGAFARPNEIALIRQYCPDVAQEIDRLTPLAAQGKGQIWGKRGKDEKGVVKVTTGMLCSTCDHRAMASGLLFDDTLSASAGSQEKENG